ncbi:unnamed protein product [Candidula unifasciata]|uniref:Endoglucanase n=1 Tax=Candidula unifasciata TaxID=100452 RepID=A0A8S3YGG4_9EUPU|nr:unnamed protein product [Candidula unifasciata]
MDLRNLLLVTAILLPLEIAAVDIPITDSWFGGFQAGACVAITTSLNGWTASLKFSDDVHSVEIWVAKVTKVSSREYRLQNEAFNPILNVGDQFCFSFVGRVTGNVTPKITFSFNGVGDSGSVASTPSSSSSSTTRSSSSSTTRSSSSTAAPSTGGSTANKDYMDALAKSILFYYAQRSGKLPANNPIPWRGDSALSDCVPGGWYDAGDHVKFGLPMASTTTLLLWSLYAFKDGYSAAQQLDAMYDVIKWPLDYFLKAWNSNTKRLTVQVGDGNADHSFWGRPEQMTMSRPCQEVSTSSPGSDVAAETAAALALGAITFKDKDTTYAAQLLTAAESLYAFAKTSRGVFSGASPFYVSSGDKDELCVAGVWLYRATRNAQYLNDARSFSDGAYIWALSWDDKRAACQELLYEETKTSSYRDAVTGFLQTWLPGGSVAYTPCGLAWRDQWGTTRYAANVAFLALVAAEAGLNTAQYRKWGVEQINYILGDNKHNGGCFSFEIGHGKQYPQQPHHRGASCPNLPATCGDAQLNADAPSPQILYGALVGGPDRQDFYQDKRTDYIQNEVATDYNSGFQGALAAINHLVATNNFPQTNNKCPCNP